jgi:hypothetical protein
MRGLIVATLGDKRSEPAHAAVNNLIHVGVLALGWHQMVDLAAGVFACTQGAILCHREVRTGA